MLEGYLVGSPKSRTRQFQGYTLIMNVEYSAVTVYAYNQEEGIVGKKVFYSNWEDAFIHYYNTLETILKSK